jgi:hypothetical protein
MSTNKINIYINVFIAAVWLVNGLFCKVLNLEPRHQQIVGEILQVTTPTAVVLNKLIGISEVLMAGWIVSRIMQKLNALTQMAIVAVMNILEFIYVPHLLLWGKYNSVFAFLFILLIFANQFLIKTKPQHV